KGARRAAGGRAPVCVAPPGRRAKGPSAPLFRFFRIFRVPRSRGPEVPPPAKGTAKEAKEAQTAFLCHGLPGCRGEGSEERVSLGPARRAVAAVGAAEGAKKA